MAEREVEWEKKMAEREMEWQTEREVEWEKKMAEREVEWEKIMAEREVEWQTEREVEWQKMAGTNGQLETKVAELRSEVQSGTEQLNEAHTQLQVQYLKIETTGTGVDCVCLSFVGEGRSDCGTRTGGERPQAERGDPH